MFALCKRFADDLIRQTCADIYFDPSKSAQASTSIVDTSTSKVQLELNKKRHEPIKKTASAASLATLAAAAERQQDSIQYQQFPHSLGVVDLFTTIKKHEVFDFLTNKHMALSTDNQEADLTSAAAADTKKKPKQAQQLYNNNNNNNNHNNNNNNISNHLDMTKSESRVTQSKSKTFLNKIFLSDSSIIK